MSSADYLRVNHSNSWIDEMNDGLTRIGVRKLVESSFAWIAMPGLKYYNRQFSAIGVRFSVLAGVFRSNCKCGVWDITLAVH